MISITHDYPKMVVPESNCPDNLIHEILEPRAIPNHMFRAAWVQISKDKKYDLHLEKDESRKFGVSDPQFELDSSWLVQTSSGATETLGAFISMVEISLVDAMGLVKGHRSPKGKFYQLDSIP